MKNQLSVDVKLFCGSDMFWEFKETQARALKEHRRRYHFCFDILSHGLDDNVEMAYLIRAIQGTM